MNRYMNQCMHVKYARSSLIVIFLIFFGTSVHAQISHEVQADGITQYTSYYANGQKKTVYYYDSTHTRTGIWVFYNSSGEVEQEINHLAQGYYRKFNKGTCVVDAPLEGMKINGKAELKWEHEGTPWELSASFANGQEQGSWRLLGPDTLDMEFNNGRPSGEWRLHNNETALKINASTSNARCEIYVDGKLKYAGSLNKQMQASGDWQVFNSRGKSKYYSAQDALASSPQYARYKQCIGQLEQAIQELPFVFYTVSNN